MNTTIVKAEEFGIEESKAIEIQKAFTPVITEKDALTEMYSALITKDLTPELAKEASQLRKKLVKVRTSTAKIHKAEKAFFLASGKFVDAWKNKTTASIEVMEEKLREIEEYQERIEAAEREALRVDREALLTPFLAEFETVTPNLGDMTAEMWEPYFTGKQAAHKARIEAEKKADNERIAAEEAEKKEAAKIEAERKAEEEKIRKENEALKKANEEAAKKAEEAEMERVKRAKIEADKRAKEEAERQRLAKIEADKKAAELKVIQDEKDRITKEAKKREEALKAELKAKEDAEDARIKTEEAQKQADLNKGDAAKVKDLILELTGIKSKYTFKSKKYQTIFNGVCQLIDKVIAYVEK